MRPTDRWTRASHVIISKFQAPEKQDSAGEVARFFFLFYVDVVGGKYSYTDLLSLEKIRPFFFFLARLNKNFKGKNSCETPTWPNSRLHNTHPVRALELELPREAIPLKVTIRDRLLKDEPKINKKAVPRRRIHFKNTKE